MWPRGVFLTCFASLLCGTWADFNLTILHTNDVHARVEQTNKYGGKCRDADAKSNKCFGGVARRKTVINQIRSKDQHVLLLDGGDQYQGTMWFNVYKGKEARIFMNDLGYNAMVSVKVDVHSSQNIPPENMFNAINAV